MSISLSSTPTRGEIEIYNAQIDEVLLERNNHHGVGTLDNQEVASIIRVSLIKRVPSFSGFISRMHNDTAFLIKQQTGSVITGLHSTWGQRL